VVFLAAFLLYSGFGNASGGNSKPSQVGCAVAVPSGCSLDDWPATVEAPNTDSRSYNLLLYHEGFPVASAGNDEAVFIEYTARMVAFAQAWKIERVMLQVFSPNSTYHGPYSVFSPESVAEHFVNKCLAAGIVPGIVGYARPKDTGWPRDDPLGAIAAYVQQVDAASQGKVPGKSCAVCSLTFDSEDLGPLGGDNLNAKILSLKTTGKMSQDVQVGFAGSYNLFSTAKETLPDVNEFFPELYWYGELMPHHWTAGTLDCTLDCVFQSPCFSEACVTTPYRAQLNNPKGMLDVVNEHLEAANIAKYTKQSARDSVHTIWALLSLEHLSGCCPERQFGPQDICGTFDGFALWDRDAFLEFLEQFAVDNGFSKDTPMPIGLYEWQFIPPHWSDPAYSKGASPVTARGVADATHTPSKCIDSMGFST